MKIAGHEETGPEVPARRKAIPAKSAVGLALPAVVAETNIVAGVSCDSLFKIESILILLYSFWLLRISGFKKRWSRGGGWAFRRCY